jgi:transitional endoplasmic reticulum ATPase
MEEVKEEIRLKIIYPLTHADMYRAYGKSIGGGFYYTAHLDAVKPI